MVIAITMTHRRVARRDASRASARREVMSRGMRRLWAVCGGSLLLNVIHR